MSATLQQMVDNLYYFQQTYPEDTCMILCDKDTIIGYLPGEKIDLGLQVGESMEKYKGAATYKVLQSGKWLREEVSAEMLGVPYVSTCMPVIENRELIGALAAVTSNQKLSDMRKGAEELNSVVKQMTQFSEEITNATAFSASELQGLSQQSELMMANMKEVEKITQQVKDIASKSNILGLNAAIEAARSGEHGKGFSVVAEEIRKMASNSNTAAENIQKQLDLTQSEITQINQSILEVSAHTQQNSAGVQEFHSMVEKVSETTHLLSRHQEMNN